MGSRELPSRAYVGSFGFKGPDQQKRVSMLSGGERNRLHLARTLKAGGNVLPRRADNDLDVDTLRALEEALLGFGLRGRDQPRPLVPGPDRDAHARLRGREPRRVLRGNYRSTRPTSGASASTPISPTACTSSG